MQLANIEIESFPVFKTFSAFYPIFLQKSVEFNAKMPRSIIYEESEKVFIETYRARAYGSYESFKNVMNSNVKNKKA